MFQTVPISSTQKRLLSIVSIFTIFVVLQIDFLFLIPLFSDPFLTLNPQCLEWKCDNKELKKPTPETMLIEIKSQNKEEQLSRIRK